MRLSLILTKSYLLSSPHLSREGPPEVGPASPARLAELPEELALHVARLRQLVHIRDHGAAPTRDPPFAAAVDHLRMGALARRHRLDDRLQLCQLLLGIVRQLARELTAARQHAEDGLERAEPAQLPELREQVVHRQLARAQVALHLLHLLAVDRPLGL